MQYIDRSVVSGMFSVGELAASTRRPVVMTGLAIALIIFQIADGLLTAVGMARFGIGMEGNAALRALMASVGVVPALIIAKTAAIATIIGLRHLGNQVRWVGQAFALIALVYVSAALAPWTIILFT